MTNDQIKEIALANGITETLLMDGSYDIDANIYDFARALFVEQQRLWDKERAAIELHEDWLESD